jgi:hydrogenase-4 component B
VALVAASGWLFLRRVRQAGSAEDATWGCGYLAPTSRMQYSASSFAEMLVRFFEGILRPHREVRPPAGAFPASSSFGSHVPEAVLELVYIPLLERANLKLSAIRKLQSGQLHLYILYIFVTLVLMLGL